MSGERRALRRAVAAALTRREFIAAAGATGALAVLPLPSVGATTERPALLEDWTIDDMWGVYPRYADPIGYPARNEEPLLAASAVDAGFVV